MVVPRPDVHTALNRVLSNNLELAHSEVEGNDAVATGHGLESESGIIVVRSEEEESAVLVSQRDAGTESVDVVTGTGDAVVDCQVQRDNAVATGGVDQSVGSGAVAGIVGDAINPYQGVASDQAVDTGGHMSDNQLQGVDVGALCIGSVGTAPGISGADLIGRILVGPIEVVAHIGINHIVDGGSDGNVKSDNTVAAVGSSQGHQRVNHVGGEQRVVPGDAVASGDGLGAGDGSATVDGVGNHHLVGSTLINSVVNESNNIGSQSAVVVVLIADILHTSSGVVVVHQVEGVVHDAVAVVGATIVEGIQLGGVLLGSLLGGEVEHMVRSIGGISVGVVAEQHGDSLVLGAGLGHNQVQYVGNVNQVISIGINLKHREVLNGLVGGEVLVVEGRVETLAHRDPSVGVAIQPGEVTAADSVNRNDGTHVHLQAHPSDAVATVGGTGNEGVVDNGIQRSVVKHAHVDDGSGIDDRVGISSHSVVDGQVQDAVTSATVGIIEGLGYIGVGIEGDAVPNVAVASRDGLLNTIVLIDDEVEGSSAVATLSVGGSVGVHTGGVVSLSIPSVAVASSVSHGAGSTGVDSQREGHNAIATVGSLVGLGVLTALGVGSIAKDTVVPSVGVASSLRQRGSNIQVDGVGNDSIVAVGVVVVPHIAHSSINGEAVAGLVRHLAFADDNSRSHGKGELVDVAAITRSNSGITVIHIIGIGSVGHTVHPGVGHIGNNVHLVEGALQDVVGGVED